MKRGKNKRKEKFEEIDKQLGLKEKIEEGAKVVMETAQKGAEVAVDVAGKSVEVVKDGVEKIKIEAEKSEVGKQAVKVAEDTFKTAEKTAKDVYEASEPIRDAAEDVTKNTAEFAKEAAKNAGGVAKEAGKKAGEVLYVATEKAGEVFEDASESFKKTTKTASDLFGFGSSVGKRSTQPTKLFQLLLAGCRKILCKPPRRAFRWLLVQDLAQVLRLSRQIGFFIRLCQRGELNRSATNSPIISNRKKNSLRKVSFRKPKRRRFVLKKTS
ncbi:MAG: hypothetical protein HC846_08460 [Blastocatellia bacterium]|nr:hypothetical protein [Blastocatellia bacterium]